jgi:hypothetical protein
MPLDLRHFVFFFEEDGDMKKILLLFGIVLILAAGYLIYLFGFKDYQVADEEVDLITKEEYVIELADGSKIVLDKHGNLIRHLPESDGASATEKPGEGVSSVESNSLAVASAASENEKAGSAEEKKKNGQLKTKKASNSTEAKKGKATVKDIQKKYEPAISDIERQANDSLNNLIDAAKEEYFEMEANDQKISYPYFYNKYSAAAATLEKRTDQIFYSLLDIIEQDLKSNGLPATLTESLSKQYENRKDKLRKDVLKKTAGL